MILFVYLVVVVALLSFVHEIIVNVRKPIQQHAVTDVPDTTKPKSKMKWDVVFGVVLVAVALVLAFFNVMILAYVLGFVGIFCIFFPEN